MQTGLALWTVDNESLMQPLLTCPADALGRAGLIIRSISGAQHTSTLALSHSSLPDKASVSVDSCRTRSPVACILETKHLTIDVDNDPVARFDLAVDDAPGERVFDFFLDEPFERPGAVRWLVSIFG